METTEIKKGTRLKHIYTGRLCVCENVTKVGDVTYIIASAGDVSSKGTLYLRYEIAEFEVVDKEQRNSAGGTG